jgi:hypothetical protein
MRWFIPSCIQTYNSLFLFPQRPLWLCGSLNSTLDRNSVSVPNKDCKLLTANFPRERKVPSSADAGIEDSATEIIEPDVVLQPC